MFAFRTIRFTFYSSNCILIVIIYVDKPVGYLKLHIFCKAFYLNNKGCCNTRFKHHVLVWSIWQEKWLQDIAEKGQGLIDVARIWKKKLYGLSKNHIDLDDGRALKRGWCVAYNSTSRMMCYLMSWVRKLLHIFECNTKHDGWFESWKVNMHIERIYGTSRFTKVDGNGKNDGRLKINYRKIKEDFERKVKET